MTEAETANDDLAYLKGLVAGDGSGEAWRLTGKVFAAGGFLYGLQTLFHWGQILGFNPPPPFTLLAVIAPTMLFLIFLTVVIIRSGPRSKPTGAMARAVSAIFGATGAVNLVLIVIFAPAAIQSGDFRVWLFYPAVFFALQGGAWLAAYQLRRKLWMLATSLGWMISAAVMGLTRGQPVYVLACAGALFLCMMLPGLVMMRRRPA
jgi:hypothetical protein